MGRSDSVGPWCGSSLSLPPVDAARCCGGGRRCSTCCCWRLHSQKACPALPWAAGIGKAFCWRESFEEKVLISQHWRWSPHLQSLACLGGTESSWPPSSARLAQAAPSGLSGFRDTGTDLTEPSAPCISVPSAATSYLSWRRWSLLLQPTTHLES